MDFTATSPHRGDLTGGTGDVVYATLLTFDRLLGRLRGDIAERKIEVEERVELWKAELAASRRRRQNGRDRMTGRAAAWDD
jgi:hypothetical protein